MAKALSIIGGILAILIVILGMYIGFFGMWNFAATGTGLSGTIWINAFGGFTSNLQLSILPTLNESLNASPGLLWVLPGLVILVGGVLAIIPKRGTEIAGGVILLVSFGLVLLYIFSGGYFQSSTDLNTEIQAIEVLAPGVQSMPIYGSTTFNLLLVSWTLSWQIGWGAILLVLCGIFALAGSGKSKSK